MNVEELNDRIMVLESQVKNLQKLQDIEDIKKLQKAYGYYLMNWMHEELIDLFSNSPDTVLEWPPGTFFGKDGARRFFSNINKNKDPEFMHQMMQISGIVNIETDGNKAKGRWWGFGVMAIPAGSMGTPDVMGKDGEGVDQRISCGIYEMEYIKEDSVWKILKIKWVSVYSGSLEEGWVKPERRFKGKPGRVAPGRFPESWEQDGPPMGVKTSYPSGYIPPFHFKHPVTGKETTEGIRNASVLGMKSNSNSNKPK
jgi:hypothetical protein